MTKIKNIKLIIVLIILLILSLFILSRMQLFKGNKDSLSRGLIAYWKFDEAKGNVISDYSGNNNQGMSVNDPSWTQGKIGGGLNLDGQNDYVEAPITINWPQLTVTVWFKPLDLTGAGGMGNPRIICNSHTDIDNKGFQLRFDRGGANGFVDVGNGKDHARVRWERQLEIGKWYFYALTYDGSQLRAYLNGSLLGSTSFTGNIAASQWPVNIGRNPVYNGDYFTGIVDEVRIYKRSLSPQEIMTLYNLGLKEGAENTNSETVNSFNEVVENKSNVQVTVIDKETKEPIEKAIVYLGGTGASGKCYTNSNGRCSIEDFVSGDYSLGVFKKGYERYSKFIHFEQGDNSLNVELEKKAKMPTSFTVKGTVIKIVTAEGTRSENKFYKIKTEDGAEEYLFDEIGVNQGFEEFVNKKVIVTGFRETGIIGWEGTKVEGIYVENIELSK